MSEAGPRRYRFGVFEVDVAAGELRRRGLRVRLHRQPFEVLCLLLARPGEVLTREEISRALWPDGTFVDFEHGLNAAVNRLREALRDRAAAPVYIETLPRRGYRFISHVEVLGDVDEGSTAKEVSAVALRSEASSGPAKQRTSSSEAATDRSRWLASAEELPEVQPRVVRLLFLLLQAMYLSFYVGALANLGEIRELLSNVPCSEGAFWVVSATSGVLIPVRIALACGVWLRPPRAQASYLQLWPVLLGADMLWALGPFLLLHHISFGLALACVAPLVYAPFAQRSLVLMGALPPRMA